MAVSERLSASDTMETYDSAVRKIVKNKHARVRVLIETVKGKPLSVVQFPSLKDWALQSLCPATPPCTKCSGYANEILFTHAK